MRMRTGKYNACFAPFGYQLVGGKLELILEQAPIIRYIYDAYLAGKTAEEDVYKRQSPATGMLFGEHLATAADTARTKSGYSTGFFKYRKATS